nr:zinc finger, CCHC-type [Tanacetum cinerariifolium]
MQSIEKTISKVNSLLIEFEKSIKRNKQPIVGTSSAPQVIAFVQNYNMQSIEKTISKVNSLLIEFEKSIKRNKQPIVGTSSAPQPIVGTSSTPQVMAIQGGRVHKYKPQGKAKEKGKGAKKLKRGSLYLYVGNGVRAEVEAIRSFDLVLPNGLIIVLDNCHYVPSVTRGVVSISRLVDKGFTQCFTDFGLSVSLNNMLYFNAITVNGIYEIDMRDSTLPIVNSKHVLKKGASYFINFTDDYSRYGYVYLLKHKHEVFETFKVKHQKLDGNILQKHEGSKQVGFKQLGPGVETGFHGVHDEKHVWFEVKLQGAQGDREAEVFQVSNNDTAMAQRWLEDKKPEEKTNTNCLSKVTKHLGVAGIQQQNGLVDEINVTLFAKVLREFEFEVEPLRDHTFEVEPRENVVQGIGLQEARLKEDMHVLSDVYVLSNGCRKSSDYTYDHYWEYAPAKGNEFGLEIIRDQSGNILRVL